MSCESAAAVVVGGCGGLWGAGLHASNFPFLLSFRISFPVAVAILPLEAVLTLTLFGILNQNAGGSPDSNKQRKAPEQLGKASMPLFDFRG